MLNTILTSNNLIYDHIHRNVPLLLSSLLLKYEPYLKDSNIFKGKEKQAHIHVSLT